MLLEEPRFAPLAKKRMSDTQVCVFLAEKACLFLCLGNEPANREGCPAAETLSSVAGIVPFPMPLKCNNVFSGDLLEKGDEIWYSMSDQDFYFPTFHHLWRGAFQWKTTTIRQQ